MSSIRRVVSDYVAQYPDPIHAHRGQTVTLKRRDPEYPGWVWCIGPDGREGWVPLAILRIDDDRAELLRDYDAHEVSVKAGEDVVVHEEIGGWARVSTADGSIGWLRADCLIEASQ
jgi:Variant SH3 domain